MLVPVRGRTLVVSSTPRVSYRCPVVAIVSGKPDPKNASGLLTKISRSR
jgi:hypothetical protein